MSFFGCHVVVFAIVAAILFEQQLQRQLMMIVQRVLLLFHFVVLVPLINLYRLQLKFVAVDVVSNGRVVVVVVDVPADDDDSYSYVVS